MATPKQAVSSDALISGSRFGACSTWPTRAFLEPMRLSRGNLHEYARSGSIMGLTGRRERPRRSDQRRGAGSGTRHDSRLAEGHWAVLDREGRSPALGAGKTDGDDAGVPRKQPRAQVNAEHEGDAARRRPWIGGEEGDAVCFALNPHRRAVRSAEIGRAHV